MTASERMIENAMDLTAVLAIEDIAAREGTATAEALVDFLASRTAAQLYDDSLKLWWDGPSAVVETYERERRKDGHGAAAG